MACLRVTHAALLPYHIICIHPLRIHSDRAGFALLNAPPLLAPAAAPDLPDGAERALRGGVKRALGGGVLIFSQDAVAARSRVNGRASHVPPRHCRGVPAFQGAGSTAANALRALLCNSQAMRR